MGASKLIKQLMTERGISVRELAERLNIAAQSMSNKLYRDNFSFKEVEKITDMLESDVRIITRDSKKEFYN